MLGLKLNHVSEKGPLGWSWAKTILAQKDIVLRWFKQPKNPRPALLGFIPGNHSHRYLVNSMQCRWFPVQRASNAEGVLISWCHHGKYCDRWVVVDLTQPFYELHGPYACSQWRYLLPTSTIFDARHQWWEARVKMFECWKNIDNIKSM